MIGASFERSDRPDVWITRSAWHFVVPKGYKEECLGYLNCWLRYLFVDKCLVLLAQTSSHLLGLMEDCFHLEREGILGAKGCYPPVRVRDTRMACTFIYIHWPRQSKISGLNRPKWIVLFVVQYIVFRHRALGARYCHDLYVSYPCMYVPAPHISPRISSGAVSVQPSSRRFAFPVSRYEIWTHPMTKWSSGITIYDPLTLIGNEARRVWSYLYVMLLYITSYAWRMLQPIPSSAWQGRFCVVACM